MALEDYLKYLELLIEAGNIAGFSYVHDRVTATCDVIEEHLGIKRPSVAQE